ncbi:unnamed protein product [Phyllotreta striolata]|uniref:Transcription termination factor 3, mitochondrial n=1 Tax=Phyllotreta striolata TaxID=444603 RepID=A0A9N9XU64_PHYSR|nr:unnamed protein product [Phyllotreta striolata]
MYRFRFIFRKIEIKYIRNASSAVEGNVSCTNTSTELVDNQQNALTKADTSKRIDLTAISKILRPGAVSSMYVNKSDILQQLLKLGVELYKLEKDPEGMKFILTLKFEDIKDTIIFLKELGVETQQIGYIITKNPLLLKESLDDLKVRINYLQYKKFTPEMITRIIENNPVWLTHSTKEIDDRLGFFQKTFSLTANNVRALATQCPRLITYQMDKVKLNLFVLKEEMGFNDVEIKKILLNKPNLFKNSQVRLLKTFEYLHNTMKIPLETIVREPEVLSCREKRLKERHSFLAKLGRDQYDPKQPNYVALTTLIKEDDVVFSTEVAKSSVQTFNNFLKSI